ncbi:MAG: hypothetical protein MUD01_24130 [Chloroflexaceae bacterium]|jgi:anti-sigma factor RsiW|nr:hypothetical protein [Chloroflexaceae bacterium]
MECSTPPALTDDDISAALDGSAEPATLAHLARCPACAARLAHTRQAEGQLSRQLARWDCPPAQRLGDYHVGLLQSDAERTIQRHLETCALCQAELEELRLFIAEREPIQRVVPVARPAAPPRRPRLRDLIAQIMPRGPAMALRGADDTTIEARADGLTIFLDVQPAPNKQLLVNGTLIADDDQERWEGALVELRQSNHLVASASLDELGSFQAGPLPPGSTDMRLVPEHGPAVRVDGVELQRL